MSRQRVMIENIEQLQKQVPSIVKAVNAEPSLALAAAANPLFAIEELGYQIPEQLRRPIEHRIRFSQEQSESLRKLSSQVRELMGEDFDIESEAELSRVLHERLKPGKGRELPAKLTMPPQLKWAEQSADPLENYRDMHPAMTPLLEYRRIEASEPRLASRELYEQVRKGAVALPAKAISFQLQRGPTPK